MTAGRIAAVITCRDLGRTLDEALASVERQTRPAAEIIIVDDASTDIYTRQALARLERDGTRIVRGDGRGASAARNLGAAMTSAECLVWLDADDTLDPGYFEMAAARLDAEPDLDFVSCAMRAFGDASYTWTPAALTLVDAIATNGVPHASTMIRRRLWDVVGGFDEELPSFELLDFWVSAIERGARGVVLDEPLLNYRVRSGSRYRRSIQPAPYLARLGHLYAKHRAAVERHGVELLLAKEAFLLGQREHRQMLESRAAALSAELADLQHEVADVARQLESHGQPRVEWGGLGRVQPISPRWGLDRGKPVDRYYIEGFLSRHRADVRGRVLEVKDSGYTRCFGGNAVDTADVIDINPANPAATVFADLRHADVLASAAYDCIILTQTLHVIDDMAAVLTECARILRSGGVLLATMPCVSRVDPESGLDGDFWRVTEASARALFAKTFPVEAFDVTAFGNVKACTAFLHGLSVEEMDQTELDRVDATFPLVIAIRAVKPSPVAQPFRAAGQSADRAGLKACAATGVSAPRAAILAYHRVAELTPDAHGLCTSPARFRAHMTHLRDHFMPMGLEDLVRAAASGRIPDRAVAVTLDDGYLDALTVASPILMELGVPATFFVNTDRLDEAHERWWDILEEIFRRDVALPPTLMLVVPGLDLHLPTATAAERAAALDQLNRAAWPLDAGARLRMADAVVAWSGRHRPPRDTHRVLTGDELRVLASRPGHAIGAHSVNHLALTTQPAETKRREVFENTCTLEHVLQRAVPLFSYPYGECDAETVSAVRDAGFSAAVTVEAGLVSAGTNRLLLPRFEITAHDARRFRDRMRDMFEAATVAAVQPS